MQTKNHLNFEDNNEYHIVFDIDYFQYCNNENCKMSFNIIAIKYFKCLIKQYFRLPGLIIARVSLTYLEIFHC